MYYDDIHPENENDVTMARVFVGDSLRLLLCVYNTRAHITLYGAEVTLGVSRIERIKSTQVNDIIINIITSSLNGRGGPKPTAIGFPYKGVWASGFSGEWTHARRTDDLLRSYVQIYIS